MSLKKSTLYKGVTAEYWKIIHIDTHYLGDVTTVQVALYKDEATRRNNPEDYLSIHIVLMQGSDLTRQQIYTALKQETVFQGAFDA